MRWKARETFAQKVDRLFEWHFWFAWKPVPIGIKDGWHIMVWLEYVERQGIYEGLTGKFAYNYRLKTGEENGCDKDVCCFKPKM